MVHYHWSTSIARAYSDRSDTDMLSEDEPVLGILILGAAAGERGHPP
jgi:hypothetical protein